MSVVKLEFRDINVKVKLIILLVASRTGTCMAESILPNSES
jgi:hypothetical protein